MLKINSMISIIQICHTFIMIINIYSLTRCNIYIHTFTQDRDYLATKRSGTLADELDRLQKTPPEIDDLLNEHDTMEETVKQHEEMLA